MAFRQVGVEYKSRITPKVLPSQVLAAAESQRVPITPYDIYDEDQIALMGLEAFTRFCRSSDGRFGLQHLPDIEEFADRKNIPGNPHLLFLARKVLSCATFIWQSMNNTTLKFPVRHDFYLKKWALTKPQFNYQFVMVDEAQDMNDVMIGVLDGQKTSVLLIGDPRQSIYQWNGAKNAMERMNCDISGTLSTSFRFGEQIARMANVVLQDYLNCDFRVTGGSGKPDKISISPIENPDAILCRSNATAMRCAMDLLRTGTTPNLVADKVEIEKTVKAIQAVQAGKTPRHAEIGQFSSMEQLVRYSNTPEGASLRPIINMMERYDTSRLLDALKSLDRKGSGPTIVTAHKAKGLEFDRVVLERDFATPPDERFSEEEGNLLYVAITRAKKELDISRHDGLKDLWRYVTLNPARSAL